LILTIFGTDDSMLFDIKPLIINKNGDVRYLLSIPYVYRFTHTSYSNISFGFINNLILIKNRQLKVPQVLHPQQLPFSFQPAFKHYYLDKNILIQVAL
jgi:hypothetical protein